MPPLRVSHHGKQTIPAGSPLAEACARAFASDDYCPLCDAHPSDGHDGDCPLVVDAMKAGGVLTPEPTEE